MGNLAQLHWWWDIDSHNCLNFEANSYLAGLKERSVSEENEVQLVFHNFLIAATTKKFQN